MIYNKYIKNKSFAEIILKRSVRKLFKLINLEIKRLPEENTSPLIFKKIDVPSLASNKAQRQKKCRK